MRPDLPWAALVTVAYLGILLLWLIGYGPPRRSSYQRRQRLRLWPRSAPPDADGLPAGVVMVLLGLLYVLWIAISRISPTLDLSELTTTSYRWSMFNMGGLTAGVVEEVAFRGTCRPVSSRARPSSPPVSRNAAGRSFHPPLRTTATQIAPASSATLDSAGQLAQNGSDVASSPQCSKPGSISERRSYASYFRFHDGSLLPCIAPCCWRFSPSIRGSQRNVRSHGNGYLHTG